MSALTDVITGLNILASYDKEDNAYISAEHDEISIGGPPPKLITAAHKKELKELGFRWSSDYDSWQRFV